ncbi:hypothetical protein ACFVWG_02205 [Kribbella sp. NPDC058245]|uniref:hypothetical protein n=1 Tax=Kribbella sp. NPDC058245 TaxID=3346399 RepID=UPI0036E38C8B
MDVQTLDGVDLTALVADMSAEDAARMRVAARLVDEVRLPKDTLRWDWWPENLQVDPVDKWVQSLVLGTTLVLYDDAGDRLELNLYVVREQRPRLTVAATLEVACWCATDHGMHVLRLEEQLVGTARPLAEAFETGADAVVRWAAGSHDPVAQRAAAGL